jgi:uncharacterized protein YndB with AHSA1/START domain
VSAPLPAPGDRARVTTWVAVAPVDAFEVFTSEIDLWWRHGIAYRGGRGKATMRFRGGAGGALIEELPDGTTRIIGKVLAWEPGARLLFEWRGSNFVGTQRTEVEVRFEAARDGTEVTLEHRGWAALPADHPARHGMEGSAFSGMIGRWWGELCSSYRERVADRVEAASR